MKVTIVTQAYNAGKYIDQCVKSVLEQTYSNFEYILVDNGCNDGSEFVIQNYADSDSRIKLVRFEKNEVSARWHTAIMEMGTGEYFTTLDADDWLEPNYLERLVGLAESIGTDIISTGSYMHIEGTQQVFDRSIEQKLVLESKDFANAFPIYHVFFRAIWAKLIRTDLLMTTPVVLSQNTGVAYGADTLNCFAWLRKAKKICIDNSILHNYRIHQKSVSHKYDTRQSFSDIYLYNDAIDFLSPYGPISPQNQDFLYRVYSCAVLDTNANIKTSTLSPAEKMREYRVILERDVTKKAYVSGSEEAVKSRDDLIGSVLNCASELADNNEDFIAIKDMYFPKCVEVICAENAKLFLADNVLFGYLINDYRKPMVKYILSLIEKQKFVKQYNLGGILQRLSQDNPFLSGISDTKFLKKYGDIYMLVWSEKYSEALDSMTDILLKETVPNELFFDLYLSLAASLECVDEFIFGKIKLAAYYCAQKRGDDCRAILDDLADMGVEDNDEMLNIRKQLKSL